MIASDRSHFAAAMTRLFAIYNDELTDNLLHAWWGALEGYPLEDVLQAMGLHAQDPKAGMFRPTPAHILAHLTDTLPAVRRKLHAQVRENLRLAIEPHDRAIRQTTNDVKLQLLAPSEGARRVTEHTAAIEAIYAQPEYRALRDHRRALRDAPSLGHDPV